MLGSVRASEQARPCAQPFPVQHIGDLFERDQLRGQLENPPHDRGFLRMRLQGLRILVVGVAEWHRPAVPIAALRLLFHFRLRLFRGVFLLILGETQHEVVLEPA